MAKLKNSVLSVEVYSMIPRVTFQKKLVVIPLESVKKFSKKRNAY